MDDPSDLADLECDFVLSGTSAQVVMSKALIVQFTALESRKQARLLANARLWADGHQPTDEQFNGNEGRCGGDNDRMLVALKTHKIRVYGFVRSFHGKKTLVLVDIDPDKKQNKANVRVLKRAKALVVDLDALCDG